MNSKQHSQSYTAVVLLVKNLLLLSNTVYGHGHRHKAKTRICMYTQSKPLGEAAMHAYMLSKTQTHDGRRTPSLFALAMNESVCICRRPLSKAGRSLSYMKTRLSPKSGVPTFFLFLSLLRFVISSRSRATSNIFR